MSSSSSNGAPSGDNCGSSSRGSSSRGSSPNSDTQRRGSSPNIHIERRSPTKMRLPSNTWTVVGQRSQRRTARPSFNIDSPVEFPTLPPRAPSPAVPSDDDHGDHDVFSASVQDALR